MDLSGNSFQDIIKLVNSMSAFETLLDAANLTPDTCVQLGIHEQFRRLLEKVGSCIKHDNTTDLNIRCMCTVCNEEIKILNFDIRMSLAIHNASEEHRVVVKTKQMNQQDKHEEPNMKEYALPLVRPLTFDMNSIPQELLKLSSDGVSPITQAKQIVNNLNNESAACIKCQQKFCVCGLKEKAAFGLSEKLTNLNVSVPPVSHHPLLPTPPHPPNVGQQYIPRGRNPSPHAFPNKKPQDNRNRSRSLAEPSRTEQSINIHVHVSPGHDQSASGAAKPTAQQKAGKTDSFEGNLDKLRTRQLGAREETQLTFRLIKVAEGKNWKQGNITKKDNDYVCNICHTGSRMNSPYDVVMHARGRFHQDNLKPNNSVRNDNPQKKTQNKTNNTERRTQTPQNDRECSNKSVGNRNDLNMELLRNRSLDEKPERSLMFRMVKQAEGQYWERSHISANGDNDFFCSVCNLQLNSPHQVVQHVQGQNHKSELENKCVIM